MPSSVSTGRTRFKIPIESGRTVGAMLRAFLRRATPGDFHLSIWPGTDGVYAPNRMRWPGPHHGPLDPHIFRLISSDLREFD